MSKKKRNTSSKKDKQGSLDLRAKDGRKIEQTELLSSMKAEKLYYVPYTTIARSEFQGHMPSECKSPMPRINLSLDNMLAASKLLATVKNERAYDLSQYPTPVRNYVTRAILAGKVSEELARLNLQIAARISTE